MKIQHAALTFWAVVTALAIGACGGSGGERLFPEIGPLPAGAEPMLLGSTQQLSLSAPQQERFFRLAVPDGATVAVSATNRLTSRASVYVAIVHETEPEEGERVVDFRYAHPKESFNSVAFERMFSAEEAGDYALFVHAEEPADFELTVDLVRQQDAGQVGDAPGTAETARVVDLASTYEGEAGSEDLKDFYRFAVPAAGLLTVRAANTSDTAFGFGARLFLDGVSRHNEFVEPGEERSFSAPVEAAAEGGLLIQSNGETTYRFTLVLEAR